MTKLVRNHSHYGAFQAEVSNGRIIGVRPFARDPDPSPLIEAIPSAVYSQTRIARPMVREGFLAHGPGSGAGRGRERFVPVSWERALDLAAGEIRRVKREHGAAAIMGGSAGWGSAGIFHEARTQTRRFLAAFGGFVDQDSNYSFGTALKFLPHVLGSAQAVTGRSRRGRRSCATAGSSCCSAAPIRRTCRSPRAAAACTTVGGCMAALARRSRGRQCESDPRRRTAGREGELDSDPAQYRRRDAARAHPHAGGGRAAR